jgi:hypothetical protein
MMCFVLGARSLQPRRRSGISSASTRPREISPLYSSRCCRPTTR